MTDKVAFIIGGGFLGLSVAHELMSKGYKVNIIDAGEQLGGLTQTFKYKDYLLEKYYHFFYWNDYAEATELLEKMNGFVDFRWKDISTDSYINGKRYNFDSPIEVFRLVGKKCFKFIFAILRIKFFKISKKLDGINAIDWAISIFGKDFASKVWIPLVEDKFCEYSSNISAYWLATRIKRHMSTKVGKGGKSRFAYLVPTYSPFINSFKDKIIATGGEVHLNSVVRNIKTDGLKVTDIETNKRSFKVNNAPVFSTIPLACLKNIKPFANSLEYLSEFETIGALLVVLVLDKQLSEYYWTTVTDDSIPFACIVQQNRLYSKDQDEIVYLSRYYSKDSLELQKNDEEVFNLYFEGLKKIYNIDLNNVIEYKVIRTDSAAPIPNTGIMDKLPSYKSSFKNFYHAGYEHILPEDRGVGNSVRVGKDLVNFYINGENNDK